MLCKDQDLVPVITMFVTPLPIIVLISAFQLRVIAVLSVVLGVILMIVAVFIVIPVVVVLVSAVVHAFLMMLIPMFVAMFTLRRCPDNYGSGYA
jgi:hypothetical protein